MADQETTTQTQPKMKEIVSQYKGICAECGKPYAVGSTILWARGYKPTHKECGPKAVVADHPILRYNAKKEMVCAAGDACKDGKVIRIGQSTVWNKILKKVWHQGCYDGPKWEEA